MDAAGHETVLHTFAGGTVVRDAAGNLYGTTAFGGAYNYGTVFELTQ